jgi:hypothetical protein
MSEADELKGHEVEGPPGEHEEARYGENRLAVTFSPIPRPATEYQKGAATAHALVLRQIDAGHSAHRIAAIQEDVQGTFDRAAATHGQREWFRGYQEAAADIVQTYGDAERAEAQLPDMEAEASSGVTKVSRQYR